MTMFELLRTTPVEMERAYLEYRRVGYQQLVAHARVHGLLDLLSEPASLRDVADRVGCRPEHEETLHRLLGALVRARAVRPIADRYLRNGDAEVGPPPRRAPIAFALGSDQADRFLSRDPANGAIPWLRHPAQPGTSDFDHGTATWAEAFRQPYYRYARLRAVTAVARGGGAVLDLGCGTGSAMVELAGSAAPPRQLVGVEASLPMLASSAAAVSGVPGAGLAQADLEQRLPFRSNYFDGALAVGLLHFVGRLDQLFAEVARVLRPRGRFSVAHTYVRRGSPDQEIVDLGMAGLRPRATAHSVPELLALAGRHGLREVGAGCFVGCFASLVFERSPAGAAGGLSRPQGVSTT